MGEGKKSQDLRFSWEDSVDICDICPDEGYVGELVWIAIITVFIL